MRIKNRNVYLSIIYVGGVGFWISVDQTKNRFGYLGSNGRRVVCIPKLF